MHRNLLRDEVFTTRGYPMAAEQAWFTEDVLPHTHDFVEIAVVLHGDAVHRSEDDSCRLARGMVFVVRPGQWHAYQDCRDEIQVLNVYLGPELISSELVWTFDHPRLLQLLLHGGRTRTRVSERELAALVAELARLGGSDGLRGTPEAARAHAFGCAVLASIAGATSARTDDSVVSTGETISPVVRRALRLLSEDISGPWQMANLAGRLAISVPHLHRVFLAEVGLPPMTWLTRSRIERATALLLGTDDPIAMIAAAVGWPDPNYFSRRFRSSTGLSPSSYRRRYRPAA